MTTEKTPPAPFPLSRQASALADGASYDLVVVGSGYGAAVVAYRAACAGKRVCVLERGREILPKAWGDDAQPSYPSTLTDVWSETQIRTDTLDYPEENSARLFDLRIGDDVSVLVGCGLGGTSLINANVALRPDPAVFTQPPWPKEIAADPRLDEFFRKAEQCLGSNPYPQPNGDRSPAGNGYPKLPKVAAMETAAKALGLPFSCPPINVSFEKKPNAFGVPQEACVLCGDCVTGCNYGAKNTTLMNYLPGAKKHGAEIFTMACVESVALVDGTWQVELLDCAGSTARPLTVRASSVVLGAGTLGSTEILLRSKAKGLAVSDQLGARFSTNGDALAWGYDLDWPANDGGLLAAAGDHRQPVYAVGAGSRLTPGTTTEPAREAWLRPGPCIAGLIDARKKLDARTNEPPAAEDAGCIIEEGVIPGAFAEVAPALGFFGDALAGDFFRYGDGRLRLQDAQAIATAIRENPAGIGEQAYRGPLSRTLSYLVMSRDDASGRLVLENDRVRVRWPGAGKERVFRRDDRTLRKVNEVLRGNFLPDPLWSDALGRQLITVHPLGGCPMAENGAEGVVNHQGRVFTGAGTEVYPSLFVCDGSIIPTALGVNPLLTITALAERTAEFVLQQLQQTSSVAAPPAASVAPVAASETRPMTPTLALDDAQEKLKDYLMTLLRPWVAAEAETAVSAALAALPGDGAVIDAQAKEELVKQKTTEIMDDLEARFLMPLATTAVALLRCLSSPSSPESEKSRLQEAVAGQVLRLVERLPAGFSPSFSFTERMSGWVSAVPLPHEPKDRPHQPTDPSHAPKDRPPQIENIDAISDPFEIASRYGQAAGASAYMVAELTISTNDLHTRATQPRSPMSDAERQAYRWQITGTVTCPDVSPEPLEVRPERSYLELLQADPHRVETWVMTYHLEFAAKAGMGGTMLDGYKILRRRSGSTPWTDLTTLFVTVTQAGKPTRHGILRLSLQDLAAQATTMTATQNADSVIGRLQSLLKCLGVWDASWDRIVGLVNAYFLAELAGLFGEVVMRAYGGLLADLENFPAQDDAVRPRRALRPSTLAPEQHPLTTADGGEIQLTRYEAPSNASGKLLPVVLAPGFMVAASSFAADTVDTNLVEYLHAAGYDVWLLDYRGSPALPTPSPFTVDDLAQYDWPAAVEYVCAIAGRPQVNVIAHCVGSLSFLMALLRPEAGQSGGLCSKIARAVCSQTTLHPVSNWLNGVKIDLDVLGVLRDTFGVEQIDLRSSTTTESRTIDAFLWGVPVPPGEECLNPLCRRVFAVFGPSWAHAQLNAATHNALLEWFGAAYAAPLEQIVEIMKRRRAVDRHGRDVYLPNHRNLANVPITFIAGELNQIFTPESSLITLEWLRHVNPNGTYARKVFPGYAHMDFFVGRNASDDVFPYLVKALGGVPPARIGVR